MELEGMEDAARNCARLLSYFREQELPVFHIQHIATREGATKWQIDAWLFKNETPNDLLYFARDDDFIELSIQYYF